MKKNTKNFARKSFFLATGLLCGSQLGLSQSNNDISLVEEAYEVVQDENLIFAMTDCRTVSGKSTDLNLKIYHSFSDSETDTYGRPKAIRYVVRSTFGGDYSAGKFELDNSETVTRKIYFLGAAANSSIEGSTIASPHYSVGISEFKYDGSHNGKDFDIDVIRRGLFKKRYVAEIRSGGLGGVTLGYNCKVEVNRLNNKN